MKRLWVTVAALMLALVPLLASAQGARGSIYGSILDETGAALPGATITLSGPFGSRATTSDASGNFRFLDLDHGRYTLGVGLLGFATLTREVLVLAGVNVTLDFTLKVTALDESLAITSETPMVDTKRTGTATTITKDELARIPSPRDPWALLRTIPGVTVDRMNLAGSESGQQSSFTSKGADPKDTTWTLDGVVITDMTVAGTTTTYFTYDMFDEININTGGASVTQLTGGLGINLVTKRGTNNFHGGFGGYFTHDDLQASNLPAELRNDPRLQGNDKADHTEQIADYSFEFGGPIVKDKLWFYGTYGRNDIRIRRLDQGRDKTVLKTYAGKLNWQASSSDLLSLFWFRGIKDKIGRTGAFGAFQHLEGTLWNQIADDPNPKGLGKLEWNHVFNPSFYMNLKTAYYGIGFQLAPQGGLESNKWVFDAIRQQGRGTAQEVTYRRPQAFVSLDLHRFVTANGGNHELTLGGSWRTTDGDIIMIWPGQKAQARLTAATSRARFYRDAMVSSQNRFASAYLADSFTRNRLAVSLGVRFDRQTARKLPSKVVANPLIPDRLPALDYPGDSEAASIWNDFSPRVAFTYALDAAKKTVVRASFARYAGQLGAFGALWNNPLAPSFLDYDWRDLNGDEIVQLGEVDLSALRASGNIDPKNPTLLRSPKAIDPDLHSNKDNEIVIGVDRELAPSLGASLAYTWRRSTDLTASQLLSGSYWNAWIGIKPSDYVRGATFSRNGYSATPFVLNPAALQRPEVTRGALLKNRPDFARVYNGIELSLTKRMSNNWMGRVAFSFNNWTEDVGPGAADQGNPTHTDADPKIDGGVVVFRSGGTGKIFYQNAKWLLSANALYQLPAGFEVSGALYGRQGYPNPIYATVDGGALDGFIRALADGTKIDTQRLPNLWNLDLRLAKNFKLRSTDLVLSVEAFNVFNAATELKRVNDFSSSVFGRLDEILAPRILRLGARVSF